MKIIDNIKSQIIKYLAPNKRENLGIWTNLYTSPSRIDYSNFVGWSFACINERAKGFAKKNIFFERQIDFETSEPFGKDYWLNYLMMNPNDYVSWYQLKNLASKWLDLYGNAYFWTPINKTVPHSIWVLPSDKITIKYSNDGGIDSYILNTPSGFKSIPRNEICHVKTLSPTMRIENNFYHGVPELINAAMDTMLSESEKQRFIKDYLQRDMTDPYVVTTPERLDIDEWNKWRTNYNEQMPPAYRVLSLLDESKRVEVLSKSTASAVTFDLSEQAKQLTAIFGVPMGLLTGELTNRATAEVLEGRFESNTIEPHAILFCEELTRHFKQFDEQIIWTYEEYTTKDLYYELELNRFRIDYGISSPEQIAREQGFTIETIVNEVVDEPIENQFKTKKKSLELIKKEYWTKNAKSMKYHEVIIANVYRKEFKELMNEITANIATQKDYKTVRLDVFFDSKVWQKRIAKKVNPKYRNLAKDIVRQAIDLIGGVMSDFESAIQTSVNASTSLIRDSLNTIQDNLKDSVRKVTNANPKATRNELIELINNEIKDKFNRDILQSRVKMIATTTATVTTGTAQKAAYKKRGYIDTWLSQRIYSGVGKTRQTHLDADGDEPDSDGYFKIGTDKMKSPATGSQAKENVNCHCTLFPKKIENE